MADRARNYCEKYTGQTIGSNSIELKFQDPVLNMTLSRLAKPLALQGGDASKLKLGDFTIDKNNSSSIDSAALYYKDMADEDLALIGRKMSHFQLYG